MKYDIIASIALLSLGRVKNNNQNIILKKKGEKVEKTLNREKYQHEKSYQTRLLISGHNREMAL